MVASDELGRCTPLCILLNRLAILLYRLRLAHLTNCIKHTFVVASTRLFCTPCFAPPHLLRPGATAPLCVSIWAYTHSAELGGLHSFMYSLLLNKLAIVKLYITG